MNAGKNRIPIAAKTVFAHESWTEYVQYCDQRDLGLRREAFAHLDRFLKQTEAWTTEAKAEFLRVLFRYLETVPFPECLQRIPQPLMTRLVEPFLQDWCARETRDSSPFVWYARHCNGGYPYLERALRINPRDDSARSLLLGMLIDNLEFSVHHFPDSYLGEYPDDLKLLAEVETHIEKLVSPERRDFWRNDLAYAASRIRAYGEWRESGTPDFAGWAEANHRDVASNVTTVYYTPKPGRNF